MLSTKELNELDRRLKETICPVCIESRPDGTCGLEALRECPITTHLLRLVEVIRSVNSDRMEPYVDKVRSDICSNCQSALYPRGQCGVRGEGHCALDAYLLVIVETIDEFLKERTAKEVVANR